MSDLVTIDIQNQIADVRLNRPEKYNALSQEMFDAIVEAGEQLVDNREIRAVVLSGNGRGFCAGLDMASFQQMDSASKDGGDKKQTASLLARDDRPENRAQRPAMVWKRVPVPVIGALHGVVYGAGAQLALGTDIRIAAPDFRMSILEIKWGLIPDMSITQTLRDLLPMDVAKELTFTGRILDGAAAKELGLVTHVSENPLDHAMELAAEIASKSPDAVRFGKKLFEETWHADARTGLQLEASLQAKLIGSENQVEAIRANFEKRAPEFKTAK
jgi:enoyl-CoA hydratase/carnithine racemase